LAFSAKAREPNAIILIIPVILGITEVFCVLFEKGIVANLNNISATATIGTTGRIVILGIVIMVFLVVLGLVEALPKFQEAYSNRWRTGKR
jgi:hypothetical protein